MNTNEFFGQLPKDDFPTEYARLISADIDAAQVNLDNLPDSQRRGLSLDTLRHFHCGFIPDWILTKSRAEFNCGLYLKPNGDIKHLPPPSERIIVPTASLSHFNAIATPSARLSLEKTFWKQHAGSMELFCDPDALNSDLILVFEGELDAMSIWQASAGSIAAVAILGCANFKKTLLPLLPNLHGKKFILLFDCDQAGLKNVEKLRADLVANGFPAVVRSFFNFLSIDDRKFFGSKVDANDILKNRGNEFLNSITQKIIADSMPDLANLDDEIHQRNLLLQQQANLPDPVIPAPTNPSKRHFSFSLPADDLDQERRIISDALKFIPAKSLSRDDWFEVGAVLKRYGFDFVVFDQWSNDGDSRYSPDSCRAQWNSFKSADELNGKGNKIGTIIRLAKKFGFVPSYKPSTQSDNDSDILQWQQDNGFIDPQLLTKLKDNAARIDAASDLIAIARDTSSLKFLGAFLHYSCFAHIADSFFAKLQIAHDNAKAKINEYKKFAANAKLYNQLRGNVDDNGKPSELDFALAALSISAVRNDVKKFKTEAARAHKRYLVQKAIDDAEAKRQADSDNYDKNPNTTQGMIPNCPVDLVLPYGIYLSDNNGIQVVDFEKSVGKGHPVIDACQNPVVPVCLYRDTDKNNKNFTQYEIAIKTDDNQWQFVTFDGRTLQDARSVSELANYGAHILNPRAFAQFFAKIIALNERNGMLRKINVYKQPGWHDGKFIWPTGGHDYIVKNGNFDYDTIFSPFGDEKKWRRMFHRVLYHDPHHYNHKNVTIVDSDGNEVSYSPDTNPANIATKPNVVAAISLGFALAAPLLKPLGLRNQQMIFGFDSGHGKTAAAKFATSFFGRPDNGLAPTLNATQNFLEDLSAKLNDFPHVVDELQSVKKKYRDDMDDWLYNFTSGTTRGRADVKGKALPTYHYRGCRFFTGEQGIVRDSSGLGAISRIFEIKKSDLFADPFAVEIHNFVLENYGFFGKQFNTEFIPQNLARIREHFERLREVYAYGNLDLVSSHASFLAVSITALRFGLEFLGYQNADEIILDVIEASQELIDDAPAKNDASNRERALAALRDFVDMHPKNFIEEISGGESEISAFKPAETNGEVLGVKMLNGNIAIFPLALKNTLDSLGFPSANAIIRSFGEAGYLDGHFSKVKPYQNRLPNYFTRWFGKSSWFYILKPADQQDDIAA